MKLQYLGDSRDAFKWDLLHWLCANSLPPFRSLAFIPLLTPNDPLPRHGQTPHSRFSCRPFIRTFLDRLRAEPRDLNAVADLGSADGQQRFEVVIPPGPRHLEAGPRRALYWQAWPEIQLTDVLVFFDPDNGFETRSQRGTKWLRHREIAAILPSLGLDGAALVYQHRPRRQAWDTVFTNLAPRLDYAGFAVAVHEANLAFIAVGSEEAGVRLGPAIEQYAAGHPQVTVRWLRRSGV
ncbi:MAG: hypothetical protein ABI955_13275 [Nitrospirota bacterium]